MLSRIVRMINGKLPPSLTVGYARHAGKSEAPGLGKTGNSQFSGNIALVRAWTRDISSHINPLVQKGIIP